MHEPLLSARGSNWPISLFQSRHSSGMPLATFSEALSNADSDLKILELDGKCAFRKDDSFEVIGGIKL